MDLEEIRQSINRVDEQMKELLLERMAYSAQVAEAKRRTGGSVYVPEREEEILRLRLQGTPEEYALECRAFFQQMIGISRMYQYTKLADGQECLSALPEGNGRVVLEFFCDKRGEMLASVFHAAALAGVTVEELSASGCQKADLDGKFGPGEASDRVQEGMLHVRLGLTGDFSEIRARAAVLQILEETQGAVLLPASMD